MRRASICRIRSRWDFERWPSGSQPLPPLPVGKKLADLADGLDQTIAASSPHPAAHRIAQIHRATSSAHLPPPPPPVMRHVLTARRGLRRCARHPRHRPPRERSRHHIRRPRPLYLAAFHCRHRRARRSIRKSRSVNYGTSVDWSDRMSTVLPTPHEFCHTLDWACTSMRSTSTCIGAPAGRRACA